MTDIRVALYGWIIVAAFLAFCGAAFWSPAAVLLKIALGLIGGLAVIGIGFGLWGGIRLARANRSAPVA